MADKRKSILLRIAPELWEGLSQWASADLRSVNAQIEYILREAVRRRERGRVLVSWADVLPWVNKLVEELRAVGLVEWVQRIQGAVGPSNSPDELVTNLRGNLTALLQRDGLPVEIAALARGLLRVTGGGV